MSPCIHRAFQIPSVGTINFYKLHGGVCPRGPLKDGRIDKDYVCTSWFFFLTCRQLGLHGGVSQPSEGLGTWAHPCPPEMIPRVVPLHTACLDSVVFWSLGISQTWVQIPHLTDLFPCSLCSLCPSHTVFSFFSISTSSCPMSGSLPRLSPLLTAPQAHPRAARAAPLSILLSSLAPCFSTFPTLITPGNDLVYVFLTVLYLPPLECTACERKDCVLYLFLCHQGLPFRYL